MGLRQPMGDQAPLSQAEGLKVFLPSFLTSFPNASPKGDEETHPEKKAEASLMQKHIDQALQKLSDKERTIFILRHYQQKKFHEIADICRITVGSAKGTLFRAIQKLQKELAFYRVDLGLDNGHE